MMDKPQLVTDVPCPKHGCNARVGEACWKDPPTGIPDGPPRRHTGPHAARKARLETARADWDRLQEWRAAVEAPPISQSTTAEYEAVD